MALLVLGGFIYWSQANTETKPIANLGGLPSFSLVNQDGKPVTQAIFQGSVHVVNFIFTSCPVTCPRLTAQMSALEKSTQGKNAQEENTGLRFLSISVDPTTDTPKRLKAYAESHGANLRRWAFLTGNPKMVDRLIIEGFKTAIDRTRGAVDIIHGEKFVLVDGAAQIRGFYSVGTAEERKALLDAAALLLKETTPKLSVAE